MKRITDEDTAYTTKKGIGISVRTLKNACINNIDYRDVYENIEHIIDAQLAADEKDCEELLTEHRRYFDKKITEAKEFVREQERRKIGEWLESKIFDEDKQFIKPSDEQVLFIWTKDIEALKSGKEVRE